MTMTHMGLPQVWKHLHHRTDITHLLHEILGQYTMSTYEKPTATIHDHTVHLFVQFRIIFDIQRTYLQARFPSAVSQSYLIPAPELFSSIRYLDQIRSELYGKISDTDKESLELRFFAARGLLSGLRALVLLESRLPSTDVDELHESVRIWCWKAKGNTIETFILEKCIYLLKQISQYSSSDEKFQVRKLSTGGQVHFRFPESRPSLSVNSSEIYGNEPTKIFSESWNSSVKVMRMLFGHCLTFYGQQKQIFSKHQLNRYLTRIPKSPTTKSITSASFWTIQMKRNFAWRKLCWNGVMRMPSLIRNLIAGQRQRYFIFNFVKSP